MAAQDCCFPAKVSNMCCSVGYRVYFIVMLTVIMLGAVVLSVVAPLDGLTYFFWVELGSILQDCLGDGDRIGWIEVSCHVIIC